MERKSILVLAPWSDSVPRRVRELAGCQITFVRPEEDYRPYLADAQVIIGEPKNEELLLCQRLELLQSPCSGVNYYTDGGTFPEGAILCSATGCYGKLIAGHMLAMTLSLCRRLPEYQQLQKQHRWQRLYHDKPLEGSTVLILGAGDIGTTLASFLRPMVRRIIGVRRTVREFPDCYDEMITLKELDDRLAEADFVLCALPHTRETAGLLNRDRLQAIKKDAVLVNGGRGSLIDQEALVQLLEVGHFWGVGLEVTSPEPLPGNHPLWDAPRCIITPHAAGNTFAPGSPLVAGIWDLMADNLEHFLSGQPLQSRIDLATGYRRL